MHDFYIKMIDTKRKSHEEIYLDVVAELWGEIIIWEEIQKKDRSDLRRLLCKLDEGIKMSKSLLDVKKLALAIQHSRSGIGGAAMTPFHCGFCRKVEVWSNTAVPLICTSCATDMAINLISNESDIYKKQ
jgi:hypothetical protein